MTQPEKLPEVRSADPWFRATLALAHEIALARRLSADDIARGDVPAGTNRYRDALRLRRHVQSRLRAGGFNLAEKLAIGDALGEWPELFERIDRKAAQACPECHGEGRFDDPRGLLSTETCGYCAGTGRADHQAVQS